MTPYIMRYVTNQSSGVSTMYNAHTFFLIPIQRSIICMTEYYKSNVPGSPIY